MRMKLRGLQLSAPRFEPIGGHFAKELRLWRAFLRCPQRAGVGVKFIDDVAVLFGIGGSMRDVGAGQHTSFITAIDICRPQTLRLPAAMDGGKYGSAARSPKLVSNTFSLSLNQDRPM